MSFHFKLPLKCIINISSRPFFDSDLLIQLYQSELGKIRDIYREGHLHHHSSGKINLQYQSASSVCSMGNIIVQSKVPGLQQVSARILQLVYRTCTQETNISRLGKRKIIFKRRGIPVWSFLLGSEFVIPTSLH